MEKKTKCLILNLRDYHGGKVSCSQTSAVVRGEDKEANQPLVQHRAALAANHQLCCGRIWLYWVTVDREKGQILLQSPCSILAGRLRAVVNGGGVSCLFPLMVALHKRNLFCPAVISGVP